MYIKLRGENKNGFPIDCTVGKVYEINYGWGGVLDRWFYDDENERNYLFSVNPELSVGNWQVVDKNGEAV